jgi:hypothetical protein
LTPGGPVEYFGLRLSLRKILIISAFAGLARITLIHALINLLKQS